MCRLSDLGLSIILLVCLIWLLSGCSRPPDNLESIPFKSRPFVLEEPSYFVKMMIPEDNLMTQEGVALGRRLFFDPILSRDSSISCGHCHQIEKSFTDGLALSNGIDQRRTRRSALPIVNLGYHYQNLFWDGRAKTLEEQAVHPILDSIEMDFAIGQAIDRIQRHPVYPVFFRKAFGIRSKSEISGDLITKAIAQYERSLVSYNSKFDRVLRGEDEYTAQEWRGYQIFFDADERIPAGECAHCHTEPLFTSLEFFNNGIQKANNIDDFEDRGRGAITHYRYDNGKFKTPTLRNISLTAPYMHDGRFQSLEEVIDHYQSGGHFTINVSPNVRKLAFTQSDKAALVAFLNCLTDTVFLQRELDLMPF